MESSPPKSPPDRLSPNEARWAGAVVLAYILCLGACKPLFAQGALARFILGNAFAFAAFYLPLWRCEKANKPWATLGLTWRHSGAELRWALGLAALTLPPFVGVMRYALAHSAELAAWTQLPLLANLPPPRALAWPADLHAWLLYAGSITFWVANHGSGVVFAEELLYRGYLLGQLTAAPSDGWGRWRSMLLTSGLFALSHWLGEWSAARLLTFLPGLLFGWLFLQRRSLLGASLYHLLCNACVYAI